MVAKAVDDVIHSMRLQNEVFIAAPIAAAFEAILEELGPASTMPGGKPMPMTLEPWPGGRWLRDLGNGTGHLWGHVQVIKPPSLLEITGPLFMSYACYNHVQYRLVAENNGTLLKLTHCAIGQITSEHREGVVEGWTHGLSRIRELAESGRRST